MSDTSPTADTSGFDPGRLRSAPTQMTRSRDDRYIGGVCGGLARYLNLDPVVVRVLVAALTVVGAVGLVLYVAAWLLAPEEGAEQSVLESHLPGSPRVRVLGWIVAGVLAVGAVVGSGPWFDWGWIGPLPLLGLAVLVWVLARPRHPAESGPDTAAANEASPAPSRVETETAPQAPALPRSPDADDGPYETDDVATDSAERPTTGPLPPDLAPPGRTARGGRHDRGTLTWLTLAALVVMIGVLWLIDQSGPDIDGPVYLAVSLAVVGVGMLVGTWWGNGRWLIPAGVALTVTLIGISQLPVWKFGEINETPTRSADVLSTYQMGAGQIRLDLTHVENLAALDGRTISIVNGLGRTEVLVPDDIDVTVTAEVNGGDIRLFDREANGADASTQYTDPDDADPNLRLDIDQSMGQVEVSRP